VLISIHADRSVNWSEISAHCAKCQWIWIQTRTTWDSGKKNISINYFFPRTSPTCTAKVVCAMCVHNRLILYDNICSENDVGIAKNTKPVQVGFDTFYVRTATGLLREFLGKWREMINIHNYIYIYMCVCLQIPSETAAVRTRIIAHVPCSLICLSAVTIWYLYLLANKILPAKCTRARAQLTLAPSDPRVHVCTNTDCKRRCRFTVTNYGTSN